VQSDIVPQVAPKKIVVTDEWEWSVAENGPLRHEDAIYAEELDLDWDADEIRRLKAATLGQLERDGMDGVGRWVQSTDQTTRALWINEDLCRRLNYLHYLTLYSSLFDLFDLK
jgi:hypothetical protein